jgi:TolB protein
MQEPEESGGRWRWRRLLVGVLVFGVVACLLALGSVALYLWPIGATREAQPVEADPSPAGEQITPEAVAPDSTAEAAPDATEPQTVQSRPGRIVYVTEQGELGTVAPDGSDERQLGAEETIYLFPAWSPNAWSSEATQLAAIGITDDGAGVFTLEDGEDGVQGAVTELYFHRQQAPIYLYWHPDGTQVSFIAQLVDRLGLFVAPASGGTEAQLMASGQPLYWDWVQNGEQLLVHSGTAGPDAVLGYVDLRSGEEQSESLAQPGYFQAPAVSSVSSFVAYAELDDEQDRWLVVANQETGDTQRTRHLGLAAMAWQPSGDELAFISPATAEGRNRFLFFGPLRLFNAQSGTLRTLTNDTVVAFFWAPDGQKIAFFTIAGSGQQQVARASGARFAIRPDIQGQEDEFRLSLWLAYPQSGEVQHMLDFRPTTLFLNQFLPFFDQYAHSHQLWSPDSSALVLPVAEEAQSQIYVISAEGPEIEAIAAGSIAFWSPR